MASARCRKTFKQMSKKGRETLTRQALPNGGKTFIRSALQNGGKSLDPSPSCKRTARKYWRSRAAKTFLRCTTAVDRHLRIPFFFVIIGLPKRPTAFPEQRWWPIYSNKRQHRSDWGRWRTTKQFWRATNQLSEFGVCESFQRRKGNGSIASMVRMFLKNPSPRART